MSFSISKLSVTPAGKELGKKVADEPTSKDETTFQIFLVLVLTLGSCSSTVISEWVKLIWLPFLQAHPSLGLGRPPPGSFLCAV